MILNQHGQSITIGDNTYTIGMKIVGSCESEYTGLIGYITEIRTECDKDTKNEGPDIYCDFYPPEDPDEILELEKTFSEFYDEPKTLDEICLDCVIMSPSMVSICDIIL